MCRQASGRAGICGGSAKRIRAARTTIRPAAAVKDIVAENGFLQGVKDLLGHQPFFGYIFRIGFNDFLFQRVNFLALGILGTLAIGGLDLVSEGADMTSHFLERIVERQYLGHQFLVDLLIDSGRLGHCGLLGGLHLRIELAILGR